MAEITKEQEIASIEVPAPFVNKLLVSYGPDGVRLAFGEDLAGGGAGAIRSAVFMSKQSATQLRDLLNTVFQQMDAVIVTDPAITPVVPATVN